jgi:hypothetical protein
MDEKGEILFHGGGPELWPGSIILPDMAHSRFVDGCPQCEAQRSGVFMPGFDPATPEGFVYATSDKEYARYYASRAVKGWLYEVELDQSSKELSSEDFFPAWRAKSAKVLRVLEKRVTLTMDERRKLFVRWGGTEVEFEQMIGSLTGPYRRHAFR